VRNRPLIYKLILFGILTWSTVNLEESFDWEIVEEPYWSLQYLWFCVRICFYSVWKFRRIYSFSRV